MTLSPWRGSALSGGLALAVATLLPACEKVDNLQMGQIVGGATVPVSAAGGQLPA